jgi:hypothetical protein
MKGLGIENQIPLKHIVLGYKIDEKNYLALNLLITVVGFSIYKSYYVSEQKTKYIDECLLQLTRQNPSSFWCFPVLSCSDYPGL